MEKNLIKLWCSIQYSLSGSMKWDSIRVEKVSKHRMENKITQKRKKKKKFNLINLKAAFRRWCKGFPFFSITREFHPERIFIFISHEKSIPIFPFDDLFQSTMRSIIHISAGSLCLPQHEEKLPHCATKGWGKFSSRLSDASTHAGER